MKNRMTWLAALLSAVAAQCAACGGGGESLTDPEALQAPDSLSAYGTESTVLGTTAGPLRFTFSGRLVPRTDLSLVWVVEATGDGEEDLLAYDPTYPASYVLMQRVPGGAFEAPQVMEVDETACVPLQAIAAGEADGAQSPGVIVAGKDCISFVRFEDKGDSQPVEMVTERTLLLQDVIPGFITGSTGTPVVGNFQFDEVREILYPELKVLVPLPLVTDDVSTAKVAKVEGIQPAALMGALDAWEPGFSSLLTAVGTTVSLQSMWNDGEFEQDCWVELTTGVATLGPLIAGNVFVAGVAQGPTLGALPTDHGSRVVGLKLENEAFSVEQALSVLGKVTCLAAGDMDGDGALEAVVGGEIKPAAKVNTPFENNPSLGYLAVVGFPRISDSEPQTFIVSPFVPAHVVIDDLDGNGKPDLLAAGVGGVVWWTQE